jgi:uncharacterized protein (DUF885 family)
MEILDMKRTILALAAAALASGFAFAAQTAPTPAPVPADLRPLLAPKQSEVKLIIQRYEADRDLLGRFYHAVTPARFSRMKRFDLDWAAALDGLKTAALSPAAKADLENLKKAVQANLKKVDFDAAEAARMAALMPFNAPIAKLEDARMAMETMDARAAAVLLSQAPDQIAKVRATLAASLGDPAKLAAFIPGRGLAVQTADAVKDLRGMLRDWFNFYNDYDPLFTWWMAQPYKQTDKDLEEYEAFLRGKVAPAVPDSPVPAAPAVDVPAAPAPRYAEVPDLAALIAVPQDEMRDIVQKFKSSLGRGGRGGGGRPETPSPTAPPQAGMQARDQGATSVSLPDRKVLDGWMKALRTLDFNKLSRAGQIAYLYMRNTLEVQLRRAALPARPAIVPKPDASGILGQPIGRDALILNLADEFIPYTPEQLIALADQQYAWCEAEMKKASNVLGFGDDWKAALEKVKTLHVEPGRQPDVIRDLLRQALVFIHANDLLSVQWIDEETLRMEMMSPQRQLVNPFFTGGAVISVSYPTSTMTTRQKLESMRGNNPHFSHATAFHEMIPGHNMQGFMSQRFGPVQSNLGTSFWGEGWALYWEMLLWDQGFHASPEDKIGALFWRMHRCARIIFSLKYHLGEWSAQECIDYIVAKVGHERENAIGEVRRSFASTYGPLYQAAYMLGALQIRALAREVVDSGQMALKQFNDAIIQGGSKPIALLRLSLGKQKLTRDMPLDWKCYGALPGPER